MVAVIATSRPKQALMQTAIVAEVFKHTLDLAKRTLVARDQVRKRRPTIIQRLLTYEALSTNLNSRAYKQVFRVSRDDFEALHELVQGPLTKNVEMGKRSGRETITSRTRLAVTLRMLAGATYADIMISFHVGNSTAYHVFHHTRKALMDVLTLPGLPKSAQELDELSLGFKHSRRKLNPFTGCVGALDGIAIKIKKPSCAYAAAFYCRKGFYALPVQALVDFRYRFLDVSIRCVGSTHDQLAHSVSQLGKYLAEKKLSIEYWIAGDEAYLCTNSLIVPIPLSQLTSCWEDSFNFYLSSLRIHVEQAFGMLVARWRILRHLEFSVEVNSQVVALCMKLHNFCIDRKPVSCKDITKEEVCERNQDVKAWYACCKERHGAWVSDNSVQLDIDGVATELVVSKRDELVEVITRKNLRRPLPLGAPCRAADL